jgi:hypothetical protein
MNIIKINVQTKKTILIIWFSILKLKLGHKSIYIYNSNIANKILTEELRIHIET